MAARCRLRISLLLLCCSVAAVSRAQTVWPPATIDAVDPTTASTTISRQFLSDEQHQLLTSPSFGQRLTTRPRLAGRPATRRDWTPIWPGGTTDGGGGSGGSGGAVGATAARPGRPGRPSRPSRPSRRPLDPAPPPSQPPNLSSSLAPGRPPVTEYYFATSASPAAAAGEPSFLPAQLPTATFAAPAASPTRALPPASARPRPVATRLGLADRLSALVTSRPARTTIISPTRAAPVPPSSATLRPAAGAAAGAAAAAAAAALAEDGGPGLEPSTRTPWATGGTAVPTEAAPEPGAAPASAPGIDASDVTPTPASAPCVVTTQSPGGYCREGDLLTVLTRDPDGSWQAYRTVQLPSSTVAALDGQEGEETTPDPVGVTPAPEDRQTGQTTPAEDEGATVTSPPQEAAPTAASVAPISEPEAGAAAAVGGSGARDHLPSAGPTLPSPAGPTLPSLEVTNESEPTTTATTEEEVAVVFPTAASAVPGPQPPTVRPWAGAGAAEPSTASVPPTEASEANKSGSAVSSETLQDHREDGKGTTLPAWQTTRRRTRPTTGTPTQPPTRETTRETFRQTTPQATRETFRQTTPQAEWEETLPPTAEETFPTTLESFPTTEETLSTTSVRAETTRPRTAPTTPPPTWPPTRHTFAPTAATTAETAPPTGPSGTSGTRGPELPEFHGQTAEPAAGADWGSATSVAPPETTAYTLAAGAHPETTQQTSTKSAELGKVSVTDPGLRAPNGSWTGGKTTDDGFSTGTYQYSTGGAVDYPSGPTGFTSPSGGRPRPTQHSPFATGSSGFSTTTRRFRPTAPSGTTGPPDYDYSTGPSGTGDGFYGGGSGGGGRGGGENYTTIGDGRLTPPPPPAVRPTDPFPTFSTDFTTPLGTDRPTETSFTSTRNPETTRGTTPDTTPGTTPGTTSGTTPGTSAPPGITHSSGVPPVEVYVQFLIGTTWPRFCRRREAFKQRVVDLVNADTHSNLTSDSAVLFNIPICGFSARERREADPASSAILVFLYLNGADGRYDRALTERVEPLWEAAAAGGGGGGGDGVVSLVREVDTHRPEQLIQSEEDTERAGIIAAITVGCVAVASLVLLAVLLVIVRHRRRAAQTAQRCNPVNLEEYGVESVFSSMRRKNKLRRSVRSYMNQAFDDHDAPSNAVNFAGLANLSSDLAALKEEFDSIPTGAMPTLDDLPPGSEDRNRYANVLPVPETRVVLEQKTGAPNSDYINANYVRGPKDEPQFYIATQGPLESTVNDFWRMIWETQSKVVVCLTDIVERGVRRCAEYLPPSEALDRHRLYGDFQVTLMAKTKKDKFVVSTIQLKNMDSNLFREVTHLWYSGWPERGVPSDLDSMVEFLQESHRAMKTNIGPTVVHCSPGTGRTGVLLACDICMRQFDASRTADIMRTVFRIRQDRAGTVQTREQYALIYKVLNQYAASVTSGNLPALE